MGSKIPGQKTVEVEYSLRPQELFWLVYNNFSSGETERYDQGSTAHRDNHPEGNHQDRRAGGGVAEQTSESREDPPRGFSAMPESMTSSKG